MPNKEIQFEQPSNILLFFNRFWIIITALVVGALLLGGYYFIIQPKMNSNNSLRDNALQTTLDKQNSEQLLKNLEKLSATYQDIKTTRQADLDRLKQIVPNNPQVAELFVLSDRLAKEYGFQLLDINISDSQDKKTTTAQTTESSEEGGTPVTTTATTTPANKNTLALKTLVVSFKVTPVAVNSETNVVVDPASLKSNYQLFKDFLDALEKNLRLTDIQTVSFASLQSDSKSAPQFQFSVQTYYR